MKVFTGVEVEEFIREFVKGLENGKYDDLLIYKKSIRKDVREYTKTTPPHIQAARKLGRTSVGKIEYIITKDGPEPIEKGQSEHCQLLSRRRIQESKTAAGGLRCHLHARGSTVGHHVSEFPRFGALRRIHHQ